MTHPDRSTGCTASVHTSYSAGVTAVREPLLRLRFAAVLAPAERLALLYRMREAHERRIEQREAVVLADAFDRMTTDFALGLSQWARDWTIALEHRVAAVG